MYCNSFTNYERFDAKEVAVGKIIMGKHQPVRVQTMTNTMTRNIEDTTNQILVCFENGADLVRITTPTIADVDALKEIKSHLKNYLFDKPIVADVHFNPKVAIAAARVADKVRINPGNFVDSKKFKAVEYSDKEYKAELNKIKEVCEPLIEVCKKCKTVLRIGTNHGSLSDRIVSRYGNTEKGLVQATIEFLEICKELDYDDVVVSIKSSNPTVMVHSNRLLVHEMKKRNLNYPIHLGVTEAGNSLEGRIKSALGVGALLVDGIGDTIRISLTEKPEKELPVAIKIVDYVSKRTEQDKLPEIKNKIFEPYSFQKRETYQIGDIGGGKVPIVIADAENVVLSLNESVPDYVITSKKEEGEYLMSELKTILKASEWTSESNSIPLFSPEEYVTEESEFEYCFVEASYDELSKDFIKKAEKKKNVVFIAKAKGNNVIGELRLFYSILEKNGCKAPVIINLNYNVSDIEKFGIYSAIDSSVFFVDGLADGILLRNCSIEDQSVAIDISFEILQAAHRRLSKTEYISCPSCGRTLFDLEEVTEKVKKSTKHLKGLKIAIMGCIVNGPGEVADADYGYIGSGNKVVTLFKGKVPVKKNIKEENAVDELIGLIKENGDWVEP